MGCRRSLKDYSEDQRDVVRRRKTWITEVIKCSDNENRKSKADN